MLYFIAPLIEAHEHVVAEKYWESACDLLQIKTQLSGVLGKRTRYQQTDIAQLVV